MINLILSVYNLFIYQPLLNLLVLLYQYLPWQDLGGAVIALTLIVRAALFPLNSQAFAAQKKLQDLQPKLLELQKKLQGDKEKQVASTLALYKEAGVSPFAGLVPLLIQLPLLIALYQLFFVFGGGNGLAASQASFLYPFVSPPQDINPLFLGIVNLSANATGALSFAGVQLTDSAAASIVLALVAGVLQFVQTKQAALPPKSDKQQSPFLQAFQKQALYLFPLVTAFILSRLPAAVGLYWATTTLFSIWQQKRVLAKKP